MYAKSLNSPRIKHRQAGMTTLGLIIFVSFVGIFAFGGIRLTPIYLDYMKVAGVVSGKRNLTAAMRLAPRFEARFLDI